MVLKILKLVAKNAFPFLLQLLVSMFILMLN